MRIKVISHKGIAPPQAISYDFDPRGGSIGRELGNQLVLPDPEKHISRTQAQIVCESGVYVLVDQGGNPSSVNGRPLGRGNRMALADGDSIEAGDYVLRVEQVRGAPQFDAAAAPAASAPVNDPLGLLGGAAVAALDPFAQSQPAAPVSPPPAFAQATPSDDPFAVFAAVAKVEPAGVASSAAASDPFAPAPVAPTRSVSSPLGFDLALAEPSVDSLFGLQSGAAPDALSGRLFDGSTSQLIGSPLGNANLDPLALLSGASQAAAAPAAPSRDDGALLNEAFVPPTPLRPQPGPTQIHRPAPSAGTEAPGPATLSGSAAPPAGMVVSWASSEPAVWAPGESAPSEHTRVVAPPSPTAAEDEAPQDMASRRPPAPVTEVQPPRRASAAEAAASAAPLTSQPLVSQPLASQPLGVAPSVSADEDQQALLAAFQRGLGVALAPPGGITPAFMEQLGAVLRESTAGTMALLTARALTKREVNAQVTMIVSKGNNPLKFSPDVHFALTQLLTPQGRGFMPPLEAMRDAYDDLRSHQFGVVAGMRAALTGIIARFKPEHLEKRLSTRGFLDSVLPGARKAKLWDLFENMYGDISREAEEDFHSLFGEAFLNAYEEQVDRLHNERPKQGGA